MVEIDEMYQALHLPTDEWREWVELQEIERDICLLYRQLAEWPYVMGNLYFGSVYALPYWEYLDVRKVRDGERAFLREGCLVMMLAMAWQMIDGAGAYLAPHLSACRAALDCVPTADERTRKLVEVVRDALNAAHAGAETEELFARSSWVHEEFVKGYFRQVATAFESYPNFDSTRRDDD